MDSSCVLRSACGTSYWYMTAPTYPNSMFSANGDGVSVTVSLKEMTPERNPDITCFSAGRSYTSCRHSRAVSNSNGKFFRVRAALSSCAARSRCCHKGTRLPGLARGRNSDRAAHSRNRAAYSTLSPTCVPMMRCSSSVSNSSSSRIGRLLSPSGRRMMMPSSAAYTCPSNPYRCLIRVVMAMAHGSCTRLPYGEWTITRQSPSSSWQRSTTSSRSLGIVPVAARCSASRSQDCRWRCHPIRHDVDVRLLSCRIGWSCLLRCRPRLPRVVLAPYRVRIGLGTVRMPRPARRLRHARTAVGRYVLEQEPPPHGPG
mgnify:CR=1 FL=1